MNIWVVISIICLGGAIGGIVNALMSDNSFVLPKTEEGVWRAGIVGNIIVSAVAAIISWGISDQIAGIQIYPVKPVTDSSTASNVQITLLTIGSLMNAVLVGIAGARWLTNEIDKKILQKAAIEAKAKPQNEDAAREMLNATPAETLKLAKR